MGRGVSCGGGQSSLGYLFGGGADAVANNTGSLNKTSSASSLPVEMQPPAGMPTRRDPVEGKIARTASVPTTTAPSPDNAAPTTKPIDKNIPAGMHSNPTNNYMRLEGQNCGNFLTERPSTKVHSTPGGGSSLGYLFGGSGGK